MCFLQLQQWGLLFVAMCGLLLPCFLLLQSTGSRARCLSSPTVPFTQLCLTLRPHGLQHAGPHCPSPTPGVYSLMSIVSVMPSNHLILGRPLLLPPSIFPSIRVFSNESALCSRWPKYWSCSSSISPSNEYSGLIFFRMDWLDLLAVQGTLKSLL